MYLIYVPAWAHKLLLPLYDLINLIISWTFCLSQGSLVFATVGLLDSSLVLKSQTLLHKRNICRFLQSCLLPFILY